METDASFMSCALPAAQPVVRTPGSRRIINEINAKRRGIAHPIGCVAVKGHSGTPRSRLHPNWVKSRYQVVEGTDFSEILTIRL